MKIRFALIISVLFAITYSTGIAGGNSAEEQVIVLADYDGVFIEAPTAPNLVVMDVRVFDADNQVVFRERSAGHPVNLLAVDLPDGEYTYEIVSVLDVSAEVEPGANVETEKDVRAHGSITVYGGEIIESRLPGGHSTNGRSEDSAWLDGLQRRVLRLAQTGLDMLVPAAQAANLTAESGEPSVNFTDTDNADLAWSLYGNSFSTGTFQLVDRIGTNAHLVWNVSGVSGTTDNENSFLTHANGNIHWSDFSMSFIKDQGLSIWTQQVNGDITIFSSAPDIHLHDNSGTQETEWALNDDNAQFWGRPNDSATWKNILSYNVNAPDDSLKITDTGTVALDGGNAIHVGDSADPVGQFAITENGIVRFEMIRTDTGNRWRFTNVGDKFAINNVDADSPDTDFNLFKTGDLVIAGALTQNSDRNAKQDIVPVDRTDVLARIARLPIAEWSYKDTPDQRHIGPMAQDFYAAFGLGMNDKGISSLDSGGVALAGIQALVEENARLRRRVEQIEVQQRDYAALEARLERLERASAGRVTAMN